jgi:thioredoxin 2
VATIRCPSCGKLNRVGPVPRGTPRCGSCKAPLPWVVDAGDAEFEQEASASVPVLVDLWAPWCGPCRMVSPALERLAQKYAGRLKLVKVNVDEAPATARRFDSRSIPTLALLRDGRELDRTVGAAPEAHLDAWLSRHLRSGANAS